MILREYSFALIVTMNCSKKKDGWVFISIYFQSGNAVEVQGMNERIELLKKYPFNMGRYLTDSERNDIRAMVTDSGVDWSEWKRKLESGEISDACQAIKSEGV